MICSGVATSAASYRVRHIGSPGIPDHNTIGQTVQAVFLYTCHELQRSLSPSPSIVEPLIRSNQTGASCKHFAAPPEKGRLH